MKAKAVYLFVLIGGLSVRADTLTLTDGRRFEEAQVVSQSPLHVTVRHAAGISQIEKALLPEPLRAKYPPDSAAAAAAAERQRERLSKAEAERERLRSELQQSAAQQRKEREATHVADAQKTTPTVVPIETEAAARHTAEYGAREHFRNEWRPGLGAILVHDLQVKIAKIEQPSGWGSQWTFSGEGFVDYSDGAEYARNKDECQLRRALVGFTGVLEDGRCLVTSRTMTVMPIAPRGRPTPHVVRRYIEPREPTPTTFPIVKNADGSCEPADPTLVQSASDEKRRKRETGVSGVPAKMSPPVHRVSSNVR